MKLRLLYNALKEAGLDQPTVDFLVTEPKLLETLILMAKMEQITWLENNMQPIGALRPALGQRRMRRGWVSIVDNALQKTKVTMSS